MKIELAQVNFAMSYLQWCLQVETAPGAVVYVTEEGPQEDLSPGRPLTTQEARVKITALGCLEHFLGQRSTTEPQPPMELPAPRSA